ncbi:MULTISPECIES: helix-turn-helix domain-containing protein [Pseudomonas syringae group]|uniref:helix-turn-helix domain-containing protein n=1 Tax=Pseudomonas syringae group TaxID=136849 RepID=UPI0005B3D487
MSKHANQKHQLPLPTDQLTGSEVSSILGIHRNTLQRMVALRTLTHDGVTGGGRRYWLRSSIDAYRLGTLTTATVWYIHSNLLEDLALKVQPGHRILGQTAASIPLAATSRAECLALLISFISKSEPHALALPAGTAGLPTTLVIAEICRTHGVPVILYPS